MANFCKDYPLACVAIAAIIITIILMFYKKSKSENATNLPCNSIYKPNSATAVACAGEDVARNPKGMTIRDYNLEKNMLSQQGI